MLSISVSYQERSGSGAVRMCLSEILKTVLTFGGNKQNQFPSSQTMRKTYDVSVVVVIFLVPYELPIVL